MMKSILSFATKSMFVVALMTVALGCAGSGQMINVNQESNVEPDSLAKAAALDHYLAGTLSEQSGDLSNAALEYQLAMYCDPTSIEIPQALSRIYLQMGEKIPAIRVLEDALARHPDDPDLLTAIGEASLRVGDINASTKYFKRLSGIQPLSREETLRQIMMLERSEKKDEALELTNDYIKLFGPDPAIYERIGLIQIGRRDFEAADLAFRKLIELDPANHRIQFVLGGFCVAREDFAGSEGYFKRAVEIEPGEVRYWANLIMVVGRVGKEDTLMILLNDAIRLFPDVPQFYDSRAGLRQELNDWIGALSDAEKSASIDSTRLAPYLAIGYICHQTNEWAKSEAAYKQALIIAPDNPVVYNNFAYMLSVQGVRLEEALGYVDKALTVSPDTPSYRDTRGWILYGLNRNEEALKEIEASLKDDPENSEIYEHLASIYRALGRIAEAEDATRKSEEFKKKEHP